MVELSWGWGVGGAAIYIPIYRISPIFIDQYRKSTILANECLGIPRYGVVSCCIPAGVVFPND